MERGNVTETSSSPEGRLLSKERNALKKDIYELQTLGTSATMEKQKQKHSNLKHMDKNLSHLATVMERSEETKV